MGQRYETDKRRERYLGDTVYHDDRGRTPDLSDTLGAGRKRMAKPKVATTPAVGEKGADPTSGKKTLMEREAEKGS